MSAIGFLRKAVKWFLYAKLCCQRTQTHYGFLLSLANQMLILLLVFKAYGKPNEVALAGLFVVILVSSFILGHLDIKRGLFREEQRLTNSQNSEFQEMMDILREIKKKGGAS